MRRARRVDANQSAIVAALRQCGASVEVLSDVGRGVPDLLVAYHQRCLLMEVKQPGEDLTDDQRDWLSRWQAPVAVVRSPQEAIDCLP